MFRLDKIIKILAQQLDLSEQDIEKFFESDLEIEEFEDAGKIKQMTSEEWAKFKHYQENPPQTEEEKEEYQRLMEKAKGILSASRRIADLRLTNSDKRVILKFIDQQPASNRKFDTDGVRLDGLWMGGRDLAHWEGDKLVIPPPSGGASQTVANFVRKNVSDRFLASIQTEDSECDDPGKRRRSRSDGRGLGKGKGKGPLGIPYKRKEKKMAFMEPVVEHGTWIMIDGPMGTEWINVEFVDMDDVKKLQDDVIENSSASLEGTSLADFAENSKINEIAVVEGYSAYLSAPGYLDRTENTVFDTEEEALDYLREMYPEEFEEEEE